MKDQLREGMSEIEVMNRDELSKKNQAEKSREMRTEQRKLDLAAGKLISDF